MSNRCPKCEGRAICYKSMQQAGEVKRYRRCKMCGHRFITYEAKSDLAIREYKSREVKDLFSVESK